MQFPTPDNLDGLPVWQNYVCSQFTQAALGLITPRIRAAGVTENGTGITFHFLVDTPIAATYPEINAIVDDFDDLTGNLLDLQIEIRARDSHVDTREVRWTYQRSHGDETLAAIELLEDRADYEAAVAVLNRDERRYAADEVRRSLDL